MSDDRRQYDRQNYVAGYDGRTGTSLRSRDMFTHEFNRLRDVDGHGERGNRRRSEFAECYRAPVLGPQFRNGSFTRIQRVELS